MAHALGSATSPVLGEILTVPDDGDAQVAASVNGPLQVMENTRLALGKLALAGLSWEGWLRADSGGSNVSPKVFFGRVYGVLLGSEVFETAGTTEVLLSNVAGSPANLSNDTWYYVYLSAPVTPPTPGGGMRAPDVVVSLAAPTGLLFGAFSTLRYIGCFRTGSTGAPRPMYMRHGRYVYSSAGGVPTLISGSAVAPATTNLANAVPPHARVSFVKCSVSAGTAGADKWVSFDSASVGQVVFVQVASEFVNTQHAVIPRAAGEDLTYTVGNAAVVAFMSVAGFTE